MSLNAQDAKNSRLFSFLLTETCILLCFLLLFLVLLRNILIILVFKEKIKVKLVLAIPTKASITVVKEIIYTPPLLCRKNN